MRVTVRLFARLRDLAGAERPPRASCPTAATAPRCVAGAAARVSGAGAVRAGRSRCAVNAGLRADGRRRCATATRSRSCRPVSGG